jgi:hypothetical protein
MCQSIAHSREAAWSRKSAVSQNPPHLSRRVYFGGKHFRSDIIRCANNGQNCDNSKISSESEIYQMWAGISVKKDVFRFKISGITPIECASAVGQGIARRIRKMIFRFKSADWIETNESESTKPSRYSDFLDGLTSQSVTGLQSEKNFEENKLNLLNFVIYFKNACLWILDFTSSNGLHGTNRKSSEDAKHQSSNALFGRNSKQCLLLNLWRSSIHCWWQSNCTIWNDC